jgi:hypothetical protein
MRGDDTVLRPGRQRASPEETTTAMTPPDRTSIERFVRGTLGCGCPDEVFQHLVVSRLPPIAGRPPIVQLQVGSRLLIQVVEPLDGAMDSDWIEQLAASGRAARDRHGYNRFRLVIAAPAPLSSVRELQECFARAFVGDEKAHLHFVGSEQLPAGLAPSAQPPQVPLEPLRADAK